MSDQWKPGAGPGPWPAMVMVHQQDGSIAALGRPHEVTNIGGRWVCSSILHPMPPTITPEQQAVLDAAERQENINGRPHSANEIGLAIRKTNAAVRAMLASQQPPDPVAELLAAARALISLYERDTCQHENTYRGGILWTICDDCDRKWADDEGGFKPYSDPAEIVNARAAIAAVEKAQKS